MSNTEEATAVQSEAPEHLATASREPAQPSLALEPGQDVAAAAQVPATGISEETQAQQQEKDATAGEKRAREDDVLPGPPAAKQPRTEPLKLGYRTFTSADTAQEYFKSVMWHAPLDANLGEQEYLALLDLLLKGHPNAASKIGVGLKGIQVGLFHPTGPKSGPKAFFVVRKDGSREDFSYLKCLQNLYPGEIKVAARVPGKPDDERKWQDKSGRGGRFGGGGGGGGGRGGRGRFGGRGRGRGRY